MEPQTLVRPARMWSASVGALAVAPPVVTLIGYETHDDAAPIRSPGRIRVLVVAEDPLARAGLAAVLSGLPECIVVGQVPPGAELSHALERQDPDALVWDAAHASTEFIDLDEGAPPVLVLSPEGQRPGPWAAGAVRGLVPRGVDALTLGAALQAITSGLLVVDPAFRGALPASPARDAIAPLDALTPREVEVLQLLAGGLANKFIAERLRISEHTVRFHLNAIFGKLDAHTRTEAVARAARLGLIVL